MIRKITFILSLATMSVGLWLITRVGPLNATCNADAHADTAFGTSTACMDIVSSYFLGYALTIGGMLIFMLSLFSLVTRNKKYGKRKNQLTIPKNHQHQVDTHHH